MESGMGLQCAPPIRACLSRERYPEQGVGHGSQFILCLGLPVSQFHPHNHHVLHDSTCILTGSVANTHVEVFPCLNMSGWCRYGIQT